MKTVHVLLIEKNDAFMGVYSTEEEARNVAKTFRIPTKIIPWNLIFPMDFSALDAALAAARS